MPAGLGQRGIVCCVCEQMIFHGVSEGERAVESAMTRNNTQQIQHRYVSNSKNFKAEMKLDESTPDSPSL